MEIYLKYIGATEEQIDWGDNDDPREILEIGNIYTVAAIEQHSWYRKIILEEFPKLKFNSIHFDTLDNEGE